MADLLPHDWDEATLVGRIDLGEGPLPIVITRGRVLDVSRTAAPHLSVAGYFGGVRQLSGPGAEFGISDRQVFTHCLLGNPTHDMYHPSSITT
jgi:fumarylacetoacetate (FAA) hydrolase family protein